MHFSLFSRLEFLYFSFFFLLFFAIENSSLDNILENDGEDDKNMGPALEQALKEAVDNETFRKVKRMSYSGHAADEVSALN